MEALLQSTPRPAPFADVLCRQCTDHSRGQTHDDDFQSSHPHHTTHTNTFRCDTHKQPSCSESLSTFCSQWAGSLRKK